MFRAGYGTMRSMSALALHLVSGWLAAWMPGGDSVVGAVWQARLDPLIRDLGDTSFAKREAATRALLAQDPKIVPLLDKARRGAGLELQRRLDRIRYHLAGYQDDLTEFLRGPAYTDAEANPPLPLDMRSMVTAHQPRTGDFLLRIIADPDHKLHRPATHVFCETWSTGSVEQLQRYLQTTFTLQAFHRAHYPQGVDAYIETRYWHRYGWGGWPKELVWQTTTTHDLDGQVHGKPYVYKYPGGGATTGWINPAKLAQGKHMVRFEVAYVFTHQGVRHEGKVRSREFVFTVGPPTLPNDLIAATDGALAKRVAAALRFEDYRGQEGLAKVMNPWQPQITWQERNLIGLHVPEWTLTEPLPVDLCFDVEIREVKTGKRHRGDPLVVHKGKTSRGYFTPRDARAFAKDRTGFIEVEIELQPSRSVALTDPAITGYFGWPITSKRMRAKIIDSKLEHEDKRP
jgi:hypothetical protein